MYKKQNYNKKPLNQDIRIRFSKDNLRNSIILIGVISLLASIKNQTNRWRLPSVEPNETGMSITQIYSKEPNTQNCSEGILNDSEKQKVLNRLNYIRQLHSLSPVNYSYKDDVYSAKSALITAANAEKNERPNPIFRCWDEQYSAVGNSLSYAISYPPGNTQISPTMNLYKSENFVDALLMDSRRKNSAGSRRLLNPFLKSISFGRVDGESLARQATIIGYDGKPVERQADYITGATIKFISDDSQNPDDLNINVNSIAYPNGEYPHQLFKKDVYQYGYPPMLFSVIKDEQKLVGLHDVDFSNSSIEISDQDGQIVEVNSIQSQANDRALPNMITWKVSQIQPNIKYTVKIKHVKVFDTINDYEYWFKLR